MPFQERDVSLFVRAECDADGFRIPIGEYRGLEQSSIVYFTGQALHQPSTYQLILEQPLLSHLGGDAWNNVLSTSVVVTDCFRTGAVAIE